MEASQVSNSRIAGIGLIGLGIAIVLAVIPGPLMLGAIRFRTSNAIENQFVGSEIVSLGLVAPIAIASGLLWLRRHPIAPALALVPTLFSIYTYSSAVLGQEYGRYDGNVEKAFPLYVLLVAGSVVLAAVAWSILSTTAISNPSSRLRRSMAIVPINGDLLIALAWAQQIRLVLTGDPPTEYVEEPTCIWVIKLFDLGFVIPAAVGAGIGLLKSSPLALRLACYVTCMAGAVAGMALAMEIEDDPSSEPLVLVVLIPVTIALAAMTLSLLRSITGGIDPR
jgi:hypothetical protein